MQSAQQLPIPTQHNSTNFLLVENEKKNNTNRLRKLHSSTPHNKQLLPWTKYAKLTKKITGNQQHLNYKTTYACEGNKMELNCDEGKLIHLVRANYGRFSLSICNENGHSNYSVQCASFRAFLFMETK